MQLSCPNCNNKIELSEEKINLLKKEADLNMCVIEETDANITALVNKKIEIKSPTVGDIEKNTFFNLLPEGEYWKQEFKKEIIVLHFTAGYNWQSAYNVFKQPGRISTPFIIDTVGPKFIVKIFDEKYWSYHLGISGLECKDWKNDKRSIGMSPLKNTTCQLTLPVKASVAGENEIFSSAIAVLIVFQPTFISNFLC